MKHTYIMMAVTLTTLSSSMLYSVNITTPYLDFRSQGINLAREFAGWHQHTYKHNVEEWHGSFFIAPSYSQSTKGENIASLMFGPDLQCDGNCGDQFIKISGSQVPKRNKHDWLADYFGLPTDFESTITFNPQIKNFILDLDLFLAINWKCHNLFVQVHAPYVYSKWQLNFCENIINEGVNDYTALYMTPHTVNRSNLLKSASEYFAGAVPALDQDVTFLPLTCTQINPSCSSETAHHIADLQINIGSYVVSDDEYHAGVGLRVVIPTGTRIDGCYLFEPIIGNGHHWELGAHGTVFVLLWANEAETLKLTGHALANLTYMFKTEQTRCFDLFDKPNSRYMLAERLGTTRQQPQLDGKDASDAGVEFQGILSPIANITTANVFAGSNFQADTVFAISMSKNNFAWDFGYSYWFHGCEDIRLRDRCKPQELNGSTWAPKGDAYVFGFFQEDPMSEILTVRLAATESNATIRSGTNNYPVGVDKVSSFQNAGVNNRVEAQASFDGGIPEKVTAINGKNMFSSKRPFFLNETNIDLSGTQGSSNKLFTHISYTWHYNPTYNFFLGAGGEYEIGKCTSISNDQKDCAASCIVADCLESSLSQWCVWIKGGFSFE